MLIILAQVQKNPRRHLPVSMTSVVGEALLWRYPGAIAAVHANQAGLGICRGHAKADLDLRSDAESRLT
jgi:hypothetical protein